MTERKMKVESLALNFEPGQPAATPFNPPPQPMAKTEVMPVSAPGTSAKTTVAVQTSPGDLTLKGVLVYLTKSDAVALKVHAALTDTSIQQLGMEAFADLFKKLDINNGDFTKVRANRKNGAK